MSEIRQLGYDEWMTLHPVFAGEFDLPIPDCRHTSIVAETEGERVKGFVAVESVPLVQVLYVFPEYRRELRVPYRLMDFVEEAAKGAGRPLYAATEVESVRKFMRRRGARKVELDVYRKGAY